MLPTIHILKALGRGGSLSYLLTPLPDTLVCILDQEPKARYPQETHQNVQAFSVRTFLPD